MKVDKLRKLLNDAMRNGDLEHKNYYGDIDAFAQDVVQYSTEKLNKRQSKELYEFAKYMF